MLFFKQKNYYLCPQLASAEIDLSNLNLTSLKTFDHNIIRTVKERIDSDTNLGFDRWFTKNVEDDIDLMIKAANHMMNHNQQLYADILDQSPAAAERKTTLAKELDGVMVKTANEIAAESLKAHRLLFNYESIYSSYEKFSSDLFRKNGLQHTEVVVGGVQNICTHLFATLNIFSSVAIATIDGATTAVVENRPTGFDYAKQEPRKMEIQEAAASPAAVPVPIPPPGLVTIPQNSGAVGAPPLIAPVVPAVVAANGKLSGANPTGPSNIAGGGIIDDMPSKDLDVVEV